MAKKKASTKGKRFTHLYLENWRNFTRVSVDLQRRVFLVGANASGKSNLLDAFRFLQDIVSVGGGFQEAVRKRGGVAKLRCLFARRHPDIVVSVSIGDDNVVDQWEYKLHFRQDKLRRPFIQREIVIKQGEVLLERPIDADKDDADRLTQTYLEQVNVNKDFRDLVEFLGDARYLHVVPQLVREPDRSIGKSNDPFGGDFLEQIARTPDKTRRAWLRRIQDALRMAVPQLDALELERNPATGTPHLRSRYLHWRPHGAWQTEDQFSDGTLRLMGLLWATLDGHGPLLLEEPELSLHPEVVRMLPQMFHKVQQRTGRQVIVSTHSRDMLADDGIGGDEVFQLIPGEEGTSVEPATSIPDLEALRQGGVGIDELVVARTKPDDTSHLTLFGTR